MVHGMYFVKMQEWRSSNNPAWSAGWLCVQSQLGRRLILLRVYKNSNRYLFTSRALSYPSMIQEVLASFIAKTLLSWALTESGDVISDRVTRVLSWLDERAEFGHELTLWCDVFKEPSVKTPQPTPLSLSSNQNALTGTKSRVSRIWQECLRQDHYCCVVPPKSDRAEAEKRLEKNEDCKDDNRKLLRRQEVTNLNTQKSHI